MSTLASEGTEGNKHVAPGKRYYLQVFEDMINLVPERMDQSFSRISAAGFAHSSGLLT